MSISHSNIMITNTLLEKYHVSVPRYTTYPTIPYWDLENDVPLHIHQFNTKETTFSSLALYVHIPFCQSLCYYCGCHTEIRDVHSDHAKNYLSFLFKEIDLMTRHFETKKRVTQLHIGGGTPNFLTKKELQQLFDTLANAFYIDRHAEITIEIDPRTVTFEQLSLLKTLGFNHISLGIQDFDIEVQKAIHRIQPFEQVQIIYTKCRELGFTEINFDLIYGLPKQHVTEFENTLKKVIILKPDQIALFNYAHVPWMKKHQKMINEHDLPTVQNKIQLFLTAWDFLKQHDYQAIGLDHFVLPNSQLAKAYQNHQLQRNCMGYTTQYADSYLGLGVSSIGYLAHDYYYQNQRQLNTYYQSIQNGRLPIERQKLLSADDQKRKWIIQQLMCYGNVDKSFFYRQFAVYFDEYFAREIPMMKQFQLENFVTMSQNEIKLTALGKIFIRNICAAFDNYFSKETEPVKTFSQAV